MTGSLSSAEDMVRALKACAGSRAGCASMGAYCTGVFISSGAGAFIKVAGVSTVLKTWVCEVMMLGLSLRSLV